MIPHKTDLDCLAYKGDLASIKNQIETLEAKDIETAKWYINERFFQGDTCLISASRWGKIEIVQYLLDHGANPNIPNNKNALPIYAAAVGKHYAIIELLKKHGAVYDENELQKKLMAKTIPGCLVLISAAGILGAIFLWMF